MKLTQQQLRQIIKEETQIALTREGARSVSAAEESIESSIIWLKDLANSIELQMVNPHSPAAIDAMSALLDKAVESAVAAWKMGNKKGDEKLP